MRKFKKFNTFDEKEIKAGLKVLKTGELSKYVGAWTRDFYGGKFVNKMENYYAKTFNVKYAISVNSW